MRNAGRKIAEMVEATAAAVGRLDQAALDGIGQIAALLTGTFEGGGRVYVCGNGGSAADAQHIAAELIGRFRRPRRRPLPCVALSTDTSALTAIGNDFGFEQVFARQVEALGRSGDVLWALTTSGSSPNVLAAVEAARRRGMKVVGMTGRGGGDLAGAADLCFRAPADLPDQVQQLHQLAYHVVCELLDEHFAAEA